jgi:hypothetical protein
MATLIDFPFLGRANVYPTPDKQRRLIINSSAMIRPAIRRPDNPVAGGKYWETAGIAWKTDASPMFLSPAVCI